MVSLLYENTCTASQNYYNKRDGCMTTLYDCIEKKKTLPVVCLEIAFGCLRLKACLLVNRNLAFAK